MSTKGASGRAERRVRGPTVCVGIVLTGTRGEGAADRYAILAPEGSLRGRWNLKPTIANCVGTEPR